MRVKIKTKKRGNQLSLRFQIFKNNLTVENLITNKKIQNFIQACQRNTEIIIPTTI